MGGVLDVLSEFSKKMEQQGNKEEILPMHHSIITRFVLMGNKAEMQDLKGENANAIPTAQIVADVEAAMGE